MSALMSPQLLVAALILGSLYGLVALGLNLIYGSMRLLNVAHGEIVMIGAFVTYSAVAFLDAPPLAGVAAAAAIASLMGGAAYFGLFARVLASPTIASRIEANSLLLFFGLSVILQNLAALVFTASPRAYPAFQHIVEFGGASVTAGRLVALAIAAAFCLAAILVLRRSMLGLSLRALIQNREATAIVGVNIARIQALAFAIGFGAAGLAGGLISMLQQITPFMGFPYTISAFVVIILGGLGSLSGSLLAGLLLGLLETYGVALLSASYRSILVYGVFILALLWRPQGLFARRSAVR